MIRNKNKALSQSSGSAGFSLVELMIVVAIIGIIVTLARPKLISLVANAKSSDAKLQLRQINALQISYFNENNRYLAAADAAGALELGFSSKSKTYTEVKIKTSGNDQYWCAWVWTKPGMLLCPNVSQDAWTLCWNGEGQFARCAWNGGSANCFTDNIAAYPDASTPLSGFNAVCF